jgi:hypothetical protein
MITILAALLVLEPRSEIPNELRPFQAVPQRAAEQSKVRSSDTPSHERLDGVECRSSRSSAVSLMVNG